MAKPWHNWPPGLRETIMERDSRLCRIQLDGCTGYATHVDHIIPPTKGGKWWDPTNLRAACRHCNLSRHKGYARPPVLPVNPRW